MHGKTETKTQSGQQEAPCPLEDPSQNKVIIGSNPRAYRSAA